MNTIKAIIATLLALLVVAAVVGLVAVAWVVIVPIGILMFIVSIVFAGFKQHYEEKKKGP